MEKIKIFLKSALALAIILAIVFVFLEISYRAYRMYKYNILVEDVDDPLIEPVRNGMEYVFKPGSEYNVKKGILYKINSKGLRDVEHDYIKDPGVFRIMAVGDSYTFGWEENLGDTYPKLLEAKLNKKYDRTCEVINAGVYGYNTEQEYEFLNREGLKYSPDLVIVGFVDNDAEPQSMVLINPKWEMERARSWFLELVKDRLNVLFKRNIFTLKRVGYSSHSWENFDWRKERCAKVFKNMRDLLNERDTPLLVMLFPSIAYQSGPIAPYEEYRYFKVIHDYIKAFCSEENIQVLDLYPYFEGRPAKDLRQETGHLNREGYTLVADAIVEYLDKRKLIE